MFIIVTVQYIFVDVNTLCSINTRVVNCNQLAELQKCLFPSQILHIDYCLQVFFKRHRSIGMVWYLTLDKSIAELHFSVSFLPPQIWQHLLIRSALSPYSVQDSSWLTLPDLRGNKENVNSIEKNLKIIPESSQLLKQQNSDK